MPVPKLGTNADEPVAGVPGATGPIVLATPPVVSESAGGHAGLAMIVMPIVSGSGSLLVTLTNRDRPLFAAAGLIFLVASVGLGVALVVGSRSSARRRQRESRERYLDYVETMRRQLRESAAAQRHAAAHRHPDPARLPDAADLPSRRWERDDRDPEFLQLRVGVGAQPLDRAVRLDADESPTTQYDPVCLTAARQLVAQYATLGEQPVRIPMRQLGTVVIAGDPRVGRALARAMVAQAAIFHSPEYLRIALVRSRWSTSSWAELKWLPHTLREPSSGDPVPSLLVTGADGPAGALDMVTTAVRHLLVVVDTPDESTLAAVHRWAETHPTRARVHLVLVLDQHSAAPENTDARVTIGVDHVVLSSANQPELWLRCDQVGAAQLSGLARRIGRSLTTDHGTRRGSVDRPEATVNEVLGTTDLRRLDVAARWEEVTERDFLRVPIGAGVTGQPVHLDLKESALGGMGPHGLVVGATGSGKSELLRTLVAALVLRHPPDRLALLLVDFKGGATFAGLTDLPHLTGMVTNLADDHGLVDRFRDALSGELQRRQQLLKDAGGLTSVREYQHRRDRFTDPLPHLLVMIDEFSELLVARPDFADLFAAVGRIGRSIGVHLVLATQRLDAGRIRGLESHLSYRLALRTFSEAESREAIGSPDAYRLDRQPGSGYLKVGQNQLDWFSAPTVSVAYRSSRLPDRGTPQVVRYPVTGPNRPPDVVPDAEAGQSPPPEPPNEAESTLEVAVSTVRAVGAPRARPVWLPPLPDVLDLGEVERMPPEPPSAGQVVGRLGLTDVPTEQRQDTLTWDFAGSVGNLVVVGAPLSGKSTLLQTLIGSLALRYRPGQLAFFCVDFGGGGLAVLEPLPHVAAVAGRADMQRVRRAIDDVHTMLDEREQLMRDAGLPTADALRLARASDEVPSEVFGDVFLIVDGWGNLRDFDPDVEGAVGDIASRGPALGVHTVVSVTAASQIRARLSPAFGGRIELRLGDRFESQIDRVAAGRIPGDLPGRALVPAGRFAQVARPRFGPAGGGPADPNDLVSEVLRRWPGERVPLVRVLPDHVDLPTVRDLAADPAPGRPSGIAIGVSERDLRPATVDLFGDEPHLVVYGDPQTGKSTLLRVLLTQLVDGRDPEDIGIVVVDYRRTHLGAVPADYLLAYCTSPQQVAQAAAEVSAGVRARLPGPDVTPEQLRTRSWWRGREVVVVVDDYDLVATASGNPLAPLTEHLAQGRDLGLHLVLARRTGGAARFQFEAVLQALNDLSGPGLLFSGERMEGRLVGDVASRRLPVGRALWVRRGRPPEQVQGAWCPLS